MLAQWIWGVTSHVRILQIRSGLYPVSSHSFCDTVYAVLSTVHSDCNTDSDCCMELGHREEFQFLSNEWSLLTFHYQHFRALLGSRFWKELVSLIKYKREWDPEGYKRGDRRPLTVQVPWCCPSSAAEAALRGRDQGCSDISLEADKQAWRSLR